MTGTGPPLSARDGRPARVGVQIAPQRSDYADIRRTCAVLEELGVDILFTWDHFFPLNRDLDGRHFECWTQLAAWAQATEREAPMGPAEPAADCMPWALACSR